MIEKFLVFYLRLLLNFIYFVIIWVRFKGVLLDGISVGLFRVCNFDMVNKLNRILKCDNNKVCFLWCFLK